MNNSQIATAVTLRDLKCYSIDTISDRILLQKKVYLVQDIGMPLGYGYSWYIHGPYSTDLTAVAYQIVPEGCEAIEGKRLKEPFSRMVESVNALETEIDSRDLKIGTVSWYELIASIAYWYKRCSNDKQRTFEKIRITKPQFSEEQVSAAYETYLGFKHPWENTNGKP